MKISFSFPLKVVVHFGLLINRKIVLNLTGLHAALEWLKVLGSNFD